MADGAPPCVALTKEGYQMLFGLQNCFCVCSPEPSLGAGAREHGLALYRAA